MAQRMINGRIVEIPPGEFADIEREWADAASEIVPDVADLAADRLDTDPVLSALADAVEAAGGKSRDEIKSDVRGRVPRRAR